jgi:hypothetical protein
LQLPQSGLFQKLVATGCNWFFEGYQMCQGCHENWTKINTLIEFLVVFSKFCIFLQGKYSLENYVVKEGVGWNDDWSIESIFK